MKEGPVNYYKHHQIITAKDGQNYVYNSLGQGVFVADSSAEAKIWILDKLSQWDVSNLQHDGIKLLTFDYYDKLYIVSVLDDIIKEYPQFDKIDYNEIGKWGWAKNAIKYFHNERGPANYCIDTKEGHYYWKGEKLSKEDWEKCLHLKGFNTVWDELISSSD